MSIGFEPVKDEWRDDEGRPATRRTGTRRTLREVKLPEGSVVTNPAYGKTNVYARDDSAVLLEARERDADTAGDRSVADLAVDYLLQAYSELPEEVQRAAEAVAEARAASVNTADRKALATKGHALPDGSYPIPDIAHLHAAAVLAASHHGDFKAAKELIRKRARELGVNTDNLPGMGTNDGDKPEDKREELPGESREQEPDTSTPEHEDPDRALRDAELRRLESRHLGL
jgi:hypothetical protein